MQGGGFQKPPGNGGCMVRKDLVKDQKWLEKIQIKNDVVFCTVFLDEEDCRELLQRILGMHIVKLKVVLNQKAIQNNIFQKGTRLDIYAEDDKGNMYDIEMQLTNCLLYTSDAADEL